MPAIISPPFRPAFLAAVAIVACSPASAFGDPRAQGTDAIECDPASEEPCLPDHAVADIALDDLTADIARRHPADYYILAGRLFEAGQRDEAVFWLYAGQLRYRIRLACHPDLPPDGESALFASLQATVGRTINGYAGASPAGWADAMQRALDWDAATENGFEPKEGCATAIEDQRAGLSRLRDRVRGLAAG